MSNFYFLLVLALLAGAAIPLQGTVNNRMATAVGSPITASFISFFVGTAALFVYTVASGSASNLTAARNAPAIAWIGGILGAFFVTASTMLIPRLGVTMSIGLIIAGQMIMSLLLDQFGWLGLDQKPISVVRVIGILLVTAGVILIRKF